MTLPRRPILITFDLDGTLIDSAPDIAYAVDTALQKLGKAAAGEAQVRNWIGNGPQMLIKRALTGGEMWPQTEPEGFSEAFPFFMSFYGEHMSERSCLFPGVASGLAELKTQGYILACNTNKYSVFTSPLLKEFGIADYFSFIGCADDFEKLKPDPEPLLKTSEHFGLRPMDCLMVGDSENDALAARRAGFMLACVPYGYHGGAGVEVLQPDALIASIAELPDLLALL